MTYLFLRVGYLKAFAANSTIRFMQIMDVLLKWLSSGSVPANILMILAAFTLVVVVLIYLIAFLQGREISFWPPKIGENEKKKEDSSTNDKIEIAREEIAQIQSKLRGIGRATENILQFHILEKVQNENGVKFDITVAGDIKPEEGIPEDKDCPYILFFTTDKKSAKQGESVHILFRILDHGWNFLPTASNAIEVMDTSTAISFKATYVGISYHLTKVDFPDNAALGYHKIVFNLRDTANNTSTQSMKILIEEA